MKLFVLLSIALIPLQTLAADNVDVYGTSAEKASFILKKYAVNVNATTTIPFKTLYKKISEKEESRLFKKYEQTKNSIIKQIKSDGDFAYVGFSTIQYPSPTKDELLYTTIEVVEKDQLSRLRFLNPQQLKRPTKRHIAKNDLITHMMNYIELDLKEMISDHQGNHKTVCPVYHCIASDFSAPTHAPYLLEFNNGVIKEKAFIQKTLKEDPDEYRRAAAAFLLGHLQSPTEILHYLQPYVLDKSAAVRNAAMRVIAMTIKKANIHNISLTPFINLLDSIYDTDRNKSLAVIHYIINSDADKKLLIAKAHKQLIALLELKQPNNHIFAYSILQKISGKNFGEHDIAAWQTWIDNARKSQLS